MHRAYWDMSNHRLALYKLTMLRAYGDMSDHRFGLYISPVEITQLTRHVPATLRFVWYEVASRVTLWRHCCNVTSVVIMGFKHNVAWNVYSTLLQRLGERTRAWWSEIDACELTQHASCSKKLKIVLRCRPIGVLNTHFLFSSSFLRWAL